MLIIIYVEPCKKKKIDAWHFNDLKHIFFFTLYTLHDINCYPLSIYTVLIFTVLTFTAVIYCSIQAHLIKVTNNN